TGSSVGLGRNAAHLVHRPAAAACHVIWHGALLAVGCLERTPRETRRPAPGESAAFGHAARLLQHASPRGPVLRKYPVRLRGGIARARTQAHGRSRRTSFGGV